MTDGRRFGIVLLLTPSQYSRFHEDAPERGPGPELADYLGIPINDAARMRGDTWQASGAT